MGNIKVDFRELEKFAKDLEKIRDKELQKVIEKTVKEIAARFLAKVIKRTPVDKGTLRRGWTAGSNSNASAFIDSIQVNKIGNVYEITISNNVEYAVYVEYGHRQEVGRFVPAIGKRLKKSWVEGKFMLTKSEIEIKGQMDKIIAKNIDTWLKEVFG